MATYVPGTQEKDLSKVIMSLQQVAPGLDAANASIAANTANIATNTTNIATNTTNIATNATNITALQAVVSHLAAPLTNVLGADVLLNNTANFFDGPSVAQGSAGIWFACATVTLFETTTAAMILKLWDGTNIAASSEGVVLSTQTINCFTLSGIFTSPPGNIRLSVRDATNTTGKILFNTTSLGKDSSITAIRLG